MIPNEKCINYDGLWEIPPDLDQEPKQQAAWVKTTFQRNALKEVHQRMTRPNLVEAKIQG